MSANINSMFYAGKKPWHSLGTAVAGELTSEEAIIKAGLNWEVKKIPVMFDPTNTLQPGVTKLMPGKFVNVRMDTMDGLGIVGPVYRPLQNIEGFKFFDSVVGEKLAMYHTAGALGIGERIWMLAKLPGEFWVTKEDNVEKYLLLMNSHDGSSAVTIMATPIRVVCQNTLNMALKEGQKTKVRHSLSMMTGIKEIREQLGIADTYFRIFEEMSKHLVSKQATTIVIDKLFDDLGLSKEVTKKSTRAENIRWDITKLFETGKGNNLPSTRGTVWALFNGVTEYVDYYRSAHGKSTQEKMFSRAESLLFGSGADMKQKALDSLLEAIK